jgi:hypothetical protein
VPPSPSQSPGPSIHPRDNNTPPLLKAQHSSPPQRPLPSEYSYTHTHPNIACMSHKLPTCATHTCTGTVSPHCPAADQPGLMSRSAALKAVRAASIRSASLPGTSSLRLNSHCAPPRTPTHPPITSHHQPNPTTTLGPSIPDCDTLHLSFGSTCEPPQPASQPVTAPSPNQWPQSRSPRSTHTWLDKAQCCVESCACCLDQICLLA